MRFIKRARWAAKNPGDALIRVLNAAYARSVSGDRRPALYDVDRTCPELRMLDRHAAEIRQELDGVLVHKDKLPRYHDLTDKETYISGTFDPDKSWKVFMLHSMLGVPRLNQAKCPRTSALLGRIPNLYQAFFSILDPGKSIPAHSTQYLGYLRYHLGLIVPTNNPPRMRVRDTWITWREGESVMFDDSLEHEVVNQSDGLRAVLIVDVLRPMPAPLHAVNWLMTQVLFRRSEEAAKVMNQIEKYSWG